jgi:septal ring factor EnvC (AmiA/AmiB activator)
LAFVHVFNRVYPAAATVGHIVGSQCEDDMANKDKRIKLLKKKLKKLRAKVKELQTAGTKKSEASAKKPAKKAEKKKPAPAADKPATQANEVPLAPVRISAAG